MAELRLATGLLVRGDRVLLVATRYAGRAEPLWNLPGGRARHGESLDRALEREFLEETGARVRTGALCFVAESYDAAGDVYVTSTTFAVETDDEPHLTGDPSVVDLAWTRRSELASRIAIAVVREPIVTHLAGDPRRHFAYADAGVSIRFTTDP